MIDDNIYEFILSIFNLNKQQVLFANYLLKKLNTDYNQFHDIDSHEIKKAIQENFDCELTDNDISYTVDKLEYDLYLIEKHYERECFKINHNGKEIIQKHGELIVYLMSEIKDRIEEVNQSQQEKNIKDQIDNLTLKQLKGTIFQINKWWLIIIINAIVTIIVSIIIALIIKDFGLN